jgi:CheY-like chemotaxis protein
MPRGDGLKLAYSVREEYPSIPIILVSGRAQPDSPFDFVEKPFTWPELVSVVRKVLTAPAPR